MKSSKEELAKRGYVEEGDLQKYKLLSEPEIYSLLKSPKAQERSIAIRKLAFIVSKEELYALLLKMLPTEKALYTKLEISSILEKADLNIARRMTKYLGEIGNNQHTVLPCNVSKKISYPLPRDCIARIMGKMNPCCIKALWEVLEENDITKISEALDAIGFLIFYHPELQTSENLKKIQAILQQYSKNELITWKGIQCLSASPLEENRKKLEELKQQYSKGTIRQEIERSLKIISKR